MPDCYLTLILVFSLPHSQQYNHKANTVTSVPGYDVSTVAWPYFNSSSLGIVLAYWQQLGYTEGKDIFSAPFDWRFPSIGLTGFYQHLQQLVEQVSASNDNLPVDLLAVSYGPQVTLGFLHRMTQTWKKRYIRWFIAESPVWSGSALPPSVFAAGYKSSPNDPEAEAEFTRMITTKVHSVMWLFPRPGNNSNAWSDDEAIVTTPSKTYVASNMTQLIADLGFEERAQSLLALQNEPDLHDFAAPGVNTFVAYGTGLQTPGSFVFTEDFVRNRSNVVALPKVINDPDGGDTLVPLRSSRRSLTFWPAAQRKLGVQFYSKG